MILKKNDFVVYWYFGRIETLRFEDKLIALWRKLSA